MIRSWGIVTLTGAAQPIFGDVLTAAFSPVTGRNAVQIVQVASTTRYAVGDRIILGFGQAGANVLLVNRVVDGTHLQCQSEGNAPLNSWANGTIIALDVACSQVTLQSLVGNAGIIWLGSDNTVTNVGGGTAFGQITIGGSWPYGVAGWNTVRTNWAWMAGTAADKVGISADIV